MTDKSYYKIPRGFSTRAEKEKTAENGGKSGPDLGSAPAPYCGSEGSGFLYPIPLIERDGPSRALIAG